MKFVDVTNDIAFKIAIKLKLIGMDFNLIAETTGLSTQQIENL